MPKSRKKKTGDFQKVKLKAGKDRKPASETNINLKTRTIKVPTSALQEAHIKKKVTFDDLLKGCDPNKSRSQRLSAVQGLRELVTDSVTNGPSFWGSRFFTFIGKVAFLFSDPDPVVRQEVIRLLKTVFFQAGKQKLNLDFFGTHLCCALSHVSEDIRRDGLTLFDLALENQPERVVGDYCGLVPGLIRQVASYMVTGTSAHWTLAANPRGRLSAQRCRTEMLLRLRKVVDVYVDIYRRENAPIREDESEVVYFGKDNPTVTGAPIPPSWKRLWSKPPPEHHWGKPKQEYADLAGDVELVTRLVSSVLPVIKECWQEELAPQDGAGPSHSTAGSGFTLRQESLPVLQTITDLLYSFVECWRCAEKIPSTENKWYQMDFPREVRDLILPHFPIAIVEKQGRVKKGQQGQSEAVSQSSSDLSPIQMSVLKLNLTLCEIFASFRPLEEDWPRVWVEPEEWQTEFVTFLLKNLKRSIQAGLLTSLGKVLREVFYHFPYTEQLGRLLTRVQKRFINAHPLSAEKSVFLKLLDELAFDLKEESPYTAYLSRMERMRHIRHDALEPYLHALPKLVLGLCEAEHPESMERIALDLIQAMRDVRSNILTEALREHMPQLLDDKTGVFARLPTSCHYAMFVAYQWAYLRVPIPEPILQQVELILRHPRVGAEVGGHFLSFTKDNLEELRVRAIEKHEDRKAPYLRFYLSVAIGHRVAELEAMDSANRPQTGDLTRIVWTCCNMDQLEKHMAIWRYHFQYFAPCLQPRQRDLENHWRCVLDRMAVIWNQQVLGRYRSLSVLTMWSALQHWMAMTCLLEQGGVSHTEVIQLPADWVCDLENNWRNRTRQLLAAMKEHMRPFMRLVFSLLYGIVAVETGPEEAEAPPPEGVREAMWKVVVELMEMSVVMWLDLLQVMTDFVQEQQSEQESMRTTLAVGKLLAAPQLQNHRIEFSERLTPQVDRFVAAVISATPQVGDKQWWLDFKNTYDSSHVPQ